MKTKKRPNTSKERTPGVHCDICGHKIRGKNHEQGNHHKGTAGKMISSKY